jgi:methionyl-tRNA formyltransferase
MLDYKNYKIIFFGSSEFALPALELLLEQGWNVTGVITQPDRPKGRELEPAATPVKNFAKKRHLSVMSFDNLSSQDARSKIMKCSADLAVVASYGQIIPASIFNASRLGFLNLHPSLLPKYRGPAPIQFVLLNGERKTGVTIISLDDKMDHGPIVAQEDEIIKPEDDFQTLHDRLARHAAKLLLKIMPGWIMGDLKPKAQDERSATYTKILTRDDGRINWKNTASAITQRIKALTPWPGMWTELDGLRYKIYKAEAETLPIQLLPGEIRFTANEIYAGCGNQTALKITLLQPAGKKVMGPKEYIMGHRAIQGKIFA